MTLLKIARMGHPVLLQTAEVIADPTARNVGRLLEDMVETMEEYFGSCTNHGECHEACPKEIPLDFIAYTNRDYVKSKRKNRKLLGQTP